jgi:glycine/serine hydroxymethyltransferase
VTGKRLSSSRQVGITVNKNAIPFDPCHQHGFGHRVGTPAVTTRGFRPDGILGIGTLIVRTSPIATIRCAGSRRRRGQAMRPLSPAWPTE